MCGTIYPHEFKEEVKHLFDVFYQVLKASQKDKNKSKKAKLDSSLDNDEIPYEASEDSELSGGLLSDSYEASEASELSGDFLSDSPGEATSNLAETEDESSFLVSNAASLSTEEQKAFSKAIIENDLLDLFAFNTKDKQPFPETKNLHSSHVFPNRFDSALEYNKDSFLCIFLPKALNASVDKKIFASTFWYTRTDLNNDKARYRIYTRDNLNLKNNYCSALDHILGEVLKMRVVNNQIVGAEVTGFDNFMECQVKFVLESYKAAGSYYCDYGPENIKRLIKPFPVQIESRKNVPREGISTQQMLLHFTALDQLEESCIQSLKFKCPYSGRV